MGYSADFSHKRETESPAVAWQAGKLLNILEMEKSSEPFMDGDTYLQQSCNLNISIKTDSSGPKKDVRENALNEVFKRRISQICDVKTQITQTL